MAEDPAEAENEPESDPVLIHQQDLQEAIMRSKADGPAPTCFDVGPGLTKIAWHPGCKQLGWLEPSAACLHQAPTWHP